MICMKRSVYFTLALFGILLARAPVASAADSDEIALPNGTQLVVHLTTTLSSRGNEEGDPWLGKVSDPIFANGVEAIPAECKVRGHVTFIKPEGRTSGKGEMRVVAETISIPDRGTFTIVALLKNADDKTGSKVKDAEGTIEGPGKSTTTMAKEAGIGAAAGAGVGSIVRGGQGALYGAAIGAMAGVIHTVAKKHQGVMLPPGTEMTFVLNQTYLSLRIQMPQEDDASSSSK
jgi:hypothetical protein